MDSTKRQNSLSKKLQPLPTTLRQRKIQIKALESQNNDLTKNDEPSMCGGPLKLVSGGSSSSESDFSDEDPPSFETYLVVHFSPTINHKTLHWIIDKIRGKALHGGANLLIRKEPQHELVIRNLTSSNF